MGLYISWVIGFRTPFDRIAPSNIKAQTFTGLGGCGSIDRYTWTLSHRLRNTRTADPSMSLINWEDIAAGQSFDRGNRQIGRNEILVTRGTIHTRRELLADVIAIDDASRPFRGSPMLRSVK